MTLAKRLIACLDVTKGRVVKGVNFENLTDIGNPVKLAKQYCDDGTDELVFLDICASGERRQPLYELIRDVASELTIPFTVGGGIRTVEEVRDILSKGADKVSINTAAVESPHLIEKLSQRFGNQCIVIAIDAKRNEHNRSMASNPIYEVYTYGGKKNTGIDVIDWAHIVESLGAGEILLTSMDRDGTREGYDVELTRAVSEVVGIPVIASGGAAGPRSFLDVLTIGKADAALAASSFHYNQYPISYVKRYLSENGVDVRV
ncbi:MAG: imidazole glycerol phosphate synthase subunit HisF [Candidatus Thorarchaeota archaeon]|nr:imidazole glycerol phosphate synthase subunit HisF [Candidatus Thorarchaeota archaeon]